MAEDFLATIDRFLAEHAELSATSFGEHTMGDPSFLPDLRAGRTPRPATVQRIKTWMERYREGGLEKAGTPQRRQPGRSSTRKSAGPAPRAVHPVIG